LITTNKTKYLHRPNLFSILEAAFQFHILILFENQICFNLSQNISFLTIGEFIQFLNYCRRSVWNITSQWDWAGTQ
jgi:hypothetical protein